MHSLLVAAPVSAMLALPVSAAEIVVTMAGAAYSPDTVSAAVGDTIRFVNDDEAAHAVFVATASHALDLGKQDPGTETELTLRQAGQFDVECVFHPGMALSVEVQ